MESYRWYICIEGVKLHCNHSHSPVLIKYLFTSLCCAHQNILILTSSRLTLLGRSGIENGRISKFNLHETYKSNPIDNDTNTKFEYVKEVCANVNEWVSGGACVYVCAREYGNWIENVRLYQTLIIICIGSEWNAMWVKVHFSACAVHAHGDKDLRFGFCVIVRAMRVLFRLSL